MTDWAMQNTERDPRNLLGAYLRPRSDSAKDLARKIGCDPRSAEGYRAGKYWPQARHWLGIVAAFGEDVTEAVFHPEKAAARLEREVRELEQQAANKRADLRALQGLGLGVAEVRSAHENRAAQLGEARAFGPTQKREGRR